MTDSADIAAGLGALARAVRLAPIALGSRGELFISYEYDAVKGWVWVWEVEMMLNDASRNCSARDENLAVVLSRIASRLDGTGGSKSHD